MKQSIKVLLLSLFVFPGAGHIFLKKYPLAFVFILSTLYLLFDFIKALHEVAQKIVDDVLLGKIAMDLSAIHQALQTKLVIDYNNFSTVSYLLLLLWIIAAFDAYRIANKSHK
ncbi:hypothetical protein [Colwellia sp. E2M01]|uniref:hypothetical protein n=1 Tax=Colwellia sp. E2M01 TaxID=2841561 RepID=UPI001C0913A0|nr:hypothetical protein [Colwellia sp. E2M01]MBU2870462.1 hypothetical protein [Colwellia sp. E2M01]